MLVKQSQVYDFSASILCSVSAEMWKRFLFYIEIQCLDTGIRLHYVFSSFPQQL